MNNNQFLAQKDMWKLGHTYIVVSAAKKDSFQCDAHKRFLLKRHIHSFMFIQYTKYTSISLFMFYHTCKPTYIIMGTILVKDVLMQTIRSRLNCSTQEKVSTKNC